MKTFLAACFAVLPAVVHAGDLDGIDTLSQPEFRQLSEDLGAAFGYKGALGAEPFGAIGYDVNAGASAVRLAHPGVWRRAAGEDASTVNLVRFGATKGLPLNIDAGGYLAIVPDAGARIYGAQLRYAVLEGGVGTPALGLAASMTRASGMAALDYTTRGLDVSLAQRFGAFTPYAGIGRIWIDSSPAAATLRDEDFAMTRTFAGVRATSLVLQFTLEAERTGDTSVYTASLGLFF